MSPDYDLERAIFDRVASKTVLSPVSKASFNRYASPQWPHLFPKEKMFSLAGNVRGKRVLEVGCGEGIEAVQLAYCGARVSGVDLSEVSIDVARRRASLEGFEIEFRAQNVLGDQDLGESCFDIVWCNLILHHLVDSLDLVMHRIRQALKPGGMFISREPIAYASWLKKLRNLFPDGQDEYDPNEQPFRDSEFIVVKKYFPDLNIRYYRILARADYVTRYLTLIRTLARIDNFLLRIPRSKVIAGDVVMWAQK